MSERSWDISDCPTLCEGCLGNNPYVRMIVDHSGSCKMCDQPYTGFKWKPSEGGGDRKTEVCPSCAQVKNICQSCTMHMQLEEILHFWFGGDQQVNYHTKWFPDGGGDVQARTDREINERFGAVFRAALRGDFTDSWTQTPRSTLALIIVLDQFSRHIFRFEERPADYEGRRAADDAALALAQRLQSHHEATVSSWPMAMMVFALMPFRHNASIDRLEFVLQQLQERETRDTQGTELMLRFRKQTVRRLQHLQDRARLEATDDILEFEPFQADESTIAQHRLVAATEQFLRRHWSSLPYQRTVVLPSASVTSTADGEATTGSEEPPAKKRGGKPVVANVLMISLSGGVDSMVISKILQWLQQHQPGLHIAAIVAVHIDYANRPESGREAAYVAEWSAQLGIQCRVRVVNEVTRGITERDAYEKIARNIRYGFYQECIQEALSGAFLTPSFVAEHAGEAIDVRVSGMMFGHHLGDVQENIISNVMRGSSPLYLSGMTETSVTNGVHVWRPLLAYVKDDIYAFSHTYGVPYFKDSTPSWSTRGKLRRQLIPLLLEVYGAGCLTNLSNLAHESDQTRDLVHANLYAPFLNSVRRFPCGLSVNILAFRHQPTCFWREVLKLLMHSMGMSLIRDKAVGNFTERIQRQAALKKMPHLQGKKASKSGDAAGEDDNPHRLQHGWLELRKGFHTFLTPQGDLVIFQDGVLRKNLVVYNVITSKNQSMQRARVTASAGEATAAPAAAAAGQAGDHAVTVSNGIAVNPKALLATTLTDLLQHVPSVAVVLEGTTSSGTLPVLPTNETHLQETITKEYPECVVTGPVDALSFSYGPWAITVDLLGVVDTTAADVTTFQQIAAQEKRPPLPVIGDALPGSFAYEVHWPVQETSTVSLVFLKDVIDYLEAYRQATSTSIQEMFRVDDDVVVPDAAAATALEAPTAQSDVIAAAALKRSFRALSVDFRFMDIRLRDGLPLLLPFSVQDTAGPLASHYHHFRITYRYQGRRADEQGSTGCEVH